MSTLWTAFRIIVTGLGVCLLADAADPDSADIVAGGTSKKAAASVEWQPLLRQSMFFLGVQHGFRLMTEPGTRDGLRGSYLRGYLRALGNMRGWADGDPFYVNYVGHPLAGAVAGNIWLQNDPAYRGYEFGDPRYWKGRLRAMAFAWAYSTQFEIGPLSEASLGQIQAHYPQIGFVDHVVTPVIGTGWMIAEDWLDKYALRRLEDRVSNRWVRLLTRSSLNPSRSMANLMAGRVPWNRATRSGVNTYGLRPHPLDLPPAAPEPRPHGPLRYTIATPANFYHWRGRECVGGSGQLSYRLSESWELLTEVGGCKMLGFDPGKSGDSLTYMVGPRWTANSDGRWVTRTYAMIGGHKVSEETELADKRRDVLATAKEVDFKLLRPQFTELAENNALAVSVGMEIDIPLSRALALRVADLGYLRTWATNPRLNEYRDGMRFSSGIVFRFEGWR